MSEATTSDTLNSAWLSRRGGTPGSCDHRAALAELVTRSLADRCPGLRSLIEHTGHARVTRLVEEVLCDALACGPQSADVASTELPRSMTPQQARRALFVALTSGGAPTSGALRELGRRAGWPLPDGVRAVALRTGTDIGLLASALGDCLVSPPGQTPCLLVPSPQADERARLHGVLRCRSAAVGHAVPLHDAAASVQWARRLLDMASPSAYDGPGAGVVFVDDHLSSLVLLQDESLARVLVARRLRPLAGLTPERCARLEATLLAWLGGGGAPEIAKALSIHPQTVRYRMRQIEKLFGARLRDPLTRFEIEMALRSRQLLAGARSRRRQSEANRRAPAAARSCKPLAVARRARVNGL